MVFYKAIWCKFSVCKLKEDLTPDIPTTVNEVLPKCPNGHTYQLAEGYPPVEELRGTKYLILYIYTCKGCHDDLCTVCNPSGVCPDCTKLENYANY